MDSFQKYLKLIIVFAFVFVAVAFSFQGKCAEGLNGIIAGMALIEAFVIFHYESKEVAK